MTISDWGTSYEEMEPYYERFEYLAGISGKAGNLNGKLQEGGNPFEGPRKRDYPNPPMDNTFGPTLFGKAATELGYKPFFLASRDTFAALYQFARRQDGPLHLLRLLHQLRLRQLLEGEPARPASCRC